MTIKKQALWGAVGIMIALVLGLGVTWMSVSKIRLGGPLDQQIQQNNALVADALPPPIFVIEPFLNLTLAVEDPAKADQALANWSKLRAQYEERKQYWLAAEMPADLKAQLRQSLQSSDAFWAEADGKLIPALRAHDIVRAQESHDNHIGPLYHRHRAEIDKLVQMEQSFAADTLDKSLTTTNWVLGVLAAISTVLFVGAVLAYRFLDRKVLAPIHMLAGQMQSMADGDHDIAVVGASRQDEIGIMARAMEVFREAGRQKSLAEQQQTHVVSSLATGLKALADGNLKHRLEVPFSAAYESLRLTFNQTMDNLSAILSSVSRAASGVHTGATEIRAASDDLSTRTEQQAASLEETAAAMNQVTAMVQEAARGASQVNQSADEAHREAAEGERVVDRAVEAMGAIERSANEIAQIISVIDGIAFQTNLLALNAGVEAARAGEAGKGFAVVANEVRALAQRSAEAAKDIKELITTSAQQVGVGVGLVGETGSMLNRMVVRVNDISRLITEISASAEKQAARLHQVNGAVSEMDKMTQQNAAMVEQSTAAARSLATEADELAKLVGRFSVAEGAGATSPARSDPKVPVAGVGGIIGNLALSEENWADF